MIRQTVDRKDFSISKEDKKHVLKLKGQTVLECDSFAEAATGLVIILKALSFLQNITHIIPR